MAMGWLEEGIQVLLIWLESILWNLEIHDTKLLIMVHSKLITNLIVLGFFVAYFLSLEGDKEAKEIFFPSYKKA